jgi:uncharacterized protein YcbK (DUF882 family)
MPTPPARASSRRRLVSALALAPLALATRVLSRAAEPARTVAFYHTHTDEQLEVTYFENGEYVAGALAQIDYLLRDFRTGEVAPIDPALLDILHRASALCGPRRFEVISGYRSAATNAALAEKSSGVARNSLHLQGRAIDVRLTGYVTGKLRDACIALALGGVGYYPESDFVHLDTGRFRMWGPARG